MTGRANNGGVVTPSPAGVFPLAPNAFSGAVAGGTAGQGGYSQADVKAAGTPGGQLPPPGGDKTAIANFVYRLIEESYNDERRRNWEIEAEDGYNFYLGNQWDSLPNDGMIRLTLNRVITCVIAMYAVQAGDPPKITFTARESGEPPLEFLNTDIPAGQEIAAAEAGMGMPFDPMQPLDPQLAGFIKAQIEQGKAMAAAAAAQGMPEPDGILPEETLVEVTDFTTAAALQTVFDAMWEECGGQVVFGENVLNKNILGISPTLYQFDDETKQHVLENIHPLQVFLDPFKSLYTKGHYEVYVEPISADEACAMQPHLEKPIREAATYGVFHFPGVSHQGASARYLQKFGRDMVVVVHCWLRHQPYPMTPDEALQAGRVKQGELPTGEMTEELDPATGLAMPAPVMRPALLHPETGEELAEGTPAWPVRYGIRQLSILANEAVEDRECEFVNIPLPWNTNLPVPFSPWGMGEPKRLKGLQQALNTALSSIVTHQAYSAVPPEVARQEVVEALGKHLERIRAKPGQRLVVPPTVASLVGNDLSKLIQYLQTADMPADAWKLVEFLLRVIDTEGNQSEVMQGNAPSGYSGDTVAALQNAASQVIKAKSLHTEHWLKWVAKLMVHSIVNRMGPADWRRYCSKYPPQALAALHAKAKQLDVDIAVEIKSGSGSTKKQQAQNVMSARTAGVPVSPQTSLENLGLDADAELQRNADWQRKTAAVMPPPPAPAPGGPAGAAANNGAA